MLNQNICRTQQLVSSLAHRPPWLRYECNSSALQLFAEPKQKEKVDAAFYGAYDIVAVTACRTGVAHTFLCAEVLNKSAKKMNLKFKVDTQGTEGAKNTLTQDEIDDAKRVILALDRGIDRDRFIGRKNVVDVSTRSFAISFI